MQRVVEEAVRPLLLRVGSEQVDPHGLGEPRFRIAHLDLGEARHQPVEGLVQSIIALVAAAQARFRHRIDLAGRNRVPGMRDQLIVEDQLGAVERRDLDGVDELGRLDEGGAVIGVERIADHLDGKGRNWSGRLFGNDGTHMIRVP